MPDKETDLTKNSDVLNSQNTMTGSLTTNPDGTVKDPYASVDDNGVLDNSQYATQPNTSTTPDKSATGSGLSAADGVNYSWDTKAEERAELDYKSAVLESKANYLTNRQEIETQGQQLQQQMDMQKYSQNQSNEKAGWTGGYVLDTERQMAYLKQTIQSQMYGQMELQKYGYDTSLAAARLAYDTNKYDLALEYYQKAIENALGEAEITGYYVSPEVSEHLDQYSIASRNLNSGKGTERDEQIVDAITKWFNSNGISKQGVETLVRQEYISTLKKTAKSLVNFQTNSELFKVDTDSFGRVDSNGNLQYTPEYDAVELIHFNQLTDDKIVEYANINSIAQSQVLGYMEGLVYADINNYLDSVKEIIKDDKGVEKETKYNVTEDGFLTYINNNSLAKVKSLIKENPELFSGFNIDYKVNDIPLYVDVVNGEIRISLNSRVNSVTKTEIEINGENATLDTLSKEAVSNNYYYKQNADGGYDIIGYNTDNMAFIVSELSKRYESVTTEVLDIFQDQTTWGNTVKQEDFDSKTSKGEAGKYLAKIIQDAKENKIPAGTSVNLQYGGGNPIPYVYIGKGKFVKFSGYVKPDFGNGYIKEFKYYIPEGYKSDFSSWDNCTRIYKK